MKKLFCLLCVSILFLFETGYSQTDSVLSYLPLAIGNQWQYQVHYVVNNSTIDTTYYSLFTVKRDTIMPNGYQYQVIVHNSETKYVHIDSTTVCVYEYQFDSTRGLLTDSLHCSEGDWFGQSIFCMLIDTATILNYNTCIMIVEHSIPGISETHTLAMDIGMASQEIITSFSFGTHKTYTLVYANINGIEFGEMVTSIDDFSNELESYNLDQNFPNPFNPLTKINFILAETGFTSLKVFDVLGNEVATLVNDVKPVGEYEVDFNGNGLTSGIYFYQLKAGKFIEIKKMLLLK